MGPRPTASLVLGLLAFPCGVLAQHVQQTERTKIGEYELGETYNEIVSPDAQKKMDTVCPQAEAHYAASIPTWPQKDPKYYVGDELGATLLMCRALADFRAGKDGGFKVPKEKLTAGIEDIAVKFHAGKICEVSIVCKQGETSFEIQRLMVTRRYGEPTKTDTVKFRNGIGAWHCEEASWALKNGDTVMVFDGIVSDQHHVFVEFLSKDKPHEPEPKNPH
ncbi:MAG: hypothetical protein WA867_02220 [Candidatus Acidiferrales bacterium]